MTEEPQRTIRTELRVGGDELLATVRELVREGNVRRIIIKREKDGRPLVEIPLTVGVIGALLLPVAAALGALAAVATGYVIVVERTTEELTATSPDGHGGGEPPGAAPS